MRKLDKLNMWFVKNFSPELHEVTLEYSAKYRDDVRKLHAEAINDPWKLVSEIKLPPPDFKSIPQLIDLYEDNGAYYWHGFSIVYNPLARTLKTIIEDIEIDRSGEIVFHELLTKRTNLRTKKKPVATTRTFVDKYKEGQNYDFKKISKKISE